MSKETKIIKDLKERNDMLKNQYMEEQARNYHLNYVIENDLMPRLKGYEFEIITLKSDFEAQHELTKKYAEENQQLKEDYNKVVHETTEWEDRYYRLQDKWDVSIIKLEHENKILKSVLDEIREIINQNMSSYASCIKAFDEIEDILDKVKE